MRTAGRRHPPRELTQVERLPRLHVITKLTRTLGRDLTEVHRKLLMGVPAKPRLTSYIAGAMSTNLA